MASSVVERPDSTKGLESVLNNGARHLCNTFSTFTKGAEVTEYSLVVIASMMLVAYGADFIENDRVGDQEYTKNGNSKARVLESISVLCQLDYRGVAKGDIGRLVCRTIMTCARLDTLPPVWNPQRDKHVPLTTTIREYLKKLLGSDAGEKAADRIDQLHHKDDNYDGSICESIINFLQWIPLDFRRDESFDDYIPHYTLRYALDHFGAYLCWNDSNGLSLIIPCFLRPSGASKLWISEKDKEIKESFFSVTVRFHEDGTPHEYGVQTPFVKESDGNVEPPLFKILLDVGTSNEFARNTIDIAIKRKKAVAAPSPSKAPAKGERQSKGEPRSLLQSPDGRSDNATPSEEKQTFKRIKIDHESSESDTEEETESESEEEAG